MTQMGDAAGAEAPLIQARDILADGFSDTAEYGHVLADFGWREVRRDNTAAAIDYFERAMKAFLADPTAFQRTIALGRNDLSVAYSLQKRWPDAERELRTAADLFRKDYGDNDPEMALATARAAKAIALQNRYEEAISILRSTITILEKPSPNAVPDYLVAAWEYLADALVQSGQLNDAGPAVKRAVALADGQSAYSQINPHFIAAEYAAMRGDAQQAEREGRHAVKLVADVFGTGTSRIQKANIRFGRILFAIGRIDEAEALFTGVMQADAANAQIYDSPWTFASVAQARVKIARGNASEAVSATEAALGKFQAQPQNIRDLNEEWDLQLTLGRSLLAADRARDALPHLTRALELRQSQFASSPRLAEAQLALAECNLRLGDTTGARALLARARAIHAANGELGEQYRKPLRNLSGRLAAAG
jgi:serine/threonine-protein kinase